MRAFYCGAIVIVPGSGRRQFTDRVTLRFVDQPGRPLILKHNGDPSPGIAGGLDAMLVPLTGGSTYVIRVDFNNYWFIGDDFAPQDWLPAGQYSVTAEFSGSKSIRGDVPCGRSGLAGSIWIFANYGRLLVQLSFLTPQVFA